MVAAEILKPKKYPAFKTKMHWKNRSVLATSASACRVNIQMLNPNVVSVVE
jgi:hypothetical protein